jgi:hypothetical protein
MAFQYADTVLASRPVEGDAVVAQVVQPLASGNVRPLPDDVERRPLTAESAETTAHWHSNWSFVAR